MTLPDTEEPEDGQEDALETEIPEGDQDEHDREGSAGGRDGEEEDHQEEEDGGVSGLEPEPRRAKASDTIRELRERAQRAEQAAQEARDLIARTTHDQTQRVNQAERDRLRNERLALMEPHERTEFLMNEKIEGLQQQFAREAMRAEDRADKAEFAALCAEDKALAAVKNDVETELARLRANGTNLQREVLANFLIGKRTRERSKAATTKQKKAGQSRLAAQTGKPGAARGEAGDGRRRGNTAAERLKDVVF